MEDLCETHLFRSLVSFAAVFFEEKRQEKENKLMAKAASKVKLEVSEEIEDAYEDAMEKLYRKVYIQCVSKADNMTDWLDFFCFRNC